MAQQTRLGRHATTVATGCDDVTRVTYHNTVIVEFDLNKTVTLDSGGWQTATTKTRMNQASSQFNLGYSVFQKDFDWFVRLESGEVVEFRDNMRLNAIEAVSGKEVLSK